MLRTNSRFNDSAKLIPGQAIAPCRCQLLENRGNQLDFGIILQSADMCEP